MRRFACVIVFLGLVASSSMAATQWVLGLTADTERNYYITRGSVTYFSATIGHAGTGRLYHSGGVLDLDILAMGYETGSVGYYELSEGGILRSFVEAIAYGGNAEFKQIGGFHTSSDGIILGYSANTPTTSGGTGHYLLEGGLLQTPDIEVNGTSCFEMTGGILEADKLNLTDNFDINLVYDGVIKIASELSFAGNASINLGSSGMLKVKSNIYDQQGISGLFGNQINGNGQLVANSELINGDLYTTVSVVPEPASLVLLGIGLLAIRRNK